MLEPRLEKTGDITPASEVITPDLEGIREAWQYLHTTPPSYRIGNSIGRLNTPLDKDTLTHLLKMPAVPDAQFLEVCSQLAHWVDGDAIPLPEGLTRLQTVTDFIPKATLLGAYSPVHGYLPALRLTAIYGGWECVLKYASVYDNRYLPDREELVEVEGQPINVTRRCGREYELTQSLRPLELTPYNFQGAEGELWVPAEINPQRHLAMWHKNLAGLQQLFDTQGWQVEIDASYQTQTSRANLSGEASNHTHDWFDLSLAIELGDGIQLDTTELMSEWLAAGTPAVLPLKNREQHWAMVDMSPLQPVLGLISLKAGGAGLNLTAADTVIHVDPWWNPAVENQATDRAYRIGQDKPVFVYKLVANGTVEEKIQALQQQKQLLADALFDATGKAGLPQTGDELLALFGT